MALAAVWGTKGGKGSKALPGVGCRAAADRRISTYMTDDMFLVGSRNSPPHPSVAHGFATFPIAGAKSCGAQRNRRITLQSPGPPHGRAFPNQLNMASQVAAEDVSFLARPGSCPRV